MSSERLIRLLEYLEETEKLKTKAPFTVPREHFAAYQHELQRLPEVRFNLQAQGDDVWLRIPRLIEVAPPAPGNALGPWITLSQSPASPPELRREITVTDARRATHREEAESHPEIRELFGWYVEYQWHPWAAAEKPRRAAIDIYNRLFSLQQAIATEGAETQLEIVWGIGQAVWNKPGSKQAVLHPLLLQSCDIALNERTLDLLVRPRDAEARLEVGCFAELEVPGVKHLETYWKGIQATSANRVNPFDASTFDGVLRAAVAHLDPSGSYVELASTVPLPAATDTLKVTNTWVLFGRKRSPDVLLEDVRRLKHAVARAETLPAVIRSFVEKGDDTVRVRPEVPFRGLSGGGAVAGAKELYFPMPYNEEQVSIVRKLGLNDGVVVQGPPGTGKTHTIANVTCHFLAQGKRVLVVSKGETALAVIQEKLPERIRSLSVALLSDERDGMKQFEHAIQTIASGVEELNPERSAKLIAAREEELEGLHARIAHLDKRIGEFAARHMTQYLFQGRQVYAEEMAKVVSAQAGEHAWMDDDLPLKRKGGPSFDDKDVSSLRGARRKVGQDLGYLEASLPPNEDLPAWPTIAAWHQDVVRSRKIDHEVTQGSIVPLVNSTPETLEKAKSLLAFIEERKALREKVFDGKPWVQPLAQRFRELGATDPTLVGLVADCRSFAEVVHRFKEFVLHAIELPPNAELDKDFLAAVQRLTEGKPAFALPFGNGDARKRIKAVAMAGVPPSTRDQWSTVQAMAQHQIEIRRVASRWKALCAEFSLPFAPNSMPEAVQVISTYQLRVADIHRIVFHFEGSLVARIREVLGKRVSDRLAVAGEPYLATVEESLRAHVDKEQLEHATKATIDLLQRLQPRSGAVVDAVKRFLAKKVGHSQVDPKILEVEWVQLTGELARVNALRPALQEIKRVADLIDGVGAPKWAQRIRSVPCGKETDLVVPTTWPAAWAWRQACLFLDAIDEHKALRKLFDDRRAATLALSRTYMELVAEKTWLGVYSNSPNSIKQALQAYLTAIKAMGAGTGVRAVRHRAKAREAMKTAYMAVPCWILPQWRVSETIPSEVGLFDLVIVDEASQSDITALPSLVRGKKLLIVGDDKQVSPSAIGIAEQHILDLQHRFLKEQPHGGFMTQDHSIYDLASVVFAGNSVLLREHFRCVPAIIEFSNREFYESDIRPLRLPKDNERLDPPLVDIVVKGGKRIREVNKAEAKAIVDEVKQIIGDPQFAGRTLGIVTLQGMHQAAYIHDLVQRQLPAGEIVRRKIAVGAPPVFQGRERDIMLISMVLGSGDRAAQNRADQHQRFNVALSRARDRMYLFRSVDATTFGEDTLNGKVIAHFHRPFLQDAHKVTTFRERCESHFETEVFDELVRRGYRVRPQVPCAGYRIDMVVEGTEGRRLAVECDGDRYHGPGQWADDMARQRVLERAGWTFWRCFASSFVRRRQEVLDDLFGTLQQLGIAPLGAESVDTTVWVEHRTADPFEVESPSDDDDSVEKEAA